MISRVSTQKERYKLGRTRHPHTRNNHTNPCGRCMIDYGRSSRGPGCGVEQDTIVNLRKGRRRTRIRTRRNGCTSGEQEGLVESWVLRGTLVGIGTNREYERRISVCTTGCYKRLKQAWRLQPSGTKTKNHSSHHRM